MLHTDTYTQQDPLPEFHTEKHTKKKKTFPTNSFVIIN